MSQHFQGTAQTVTTDPSCFHNTIMSIWHAHRRCASVFNHVSSFEFNAILPTRGFEPDVASRVKSAKHPTWTFRIHKAELTAKSSVDLGLTIQRVNKRRQQEMDERTRQDKGR